MRMLDVTVDPSVIPPEVAQTIKNDYELAMKYLMITQREPDAKLLKRVKKRFEWALTFLIVRYGFVHQVLSMTTKHPSMKLMTMGVTVSGGARFQLYYNPYFVDCLTNEELVYVFYHEVMHLVLHHCTSRQFSLKELGGIAHDLAVNELLPDIKGSCERPTLNGKLFGTFVSEFKKIPKYVKIEDRKSSEWYYEFLKDNTESPNGKGGDDPGEGQGNANSFDDHDGWKQDEMAAERVRAMVKHIDRNNLWGDLSDGAKETIRAAQVRKINWRNLIRRFLGNHAWTTRTHTRKRPNRRMGYIYAGSRRDYVDRHLVAIDTSLSVDSNMLAKFLAVMNGMVDFIPIDIMEFDAAVTSKPRPYDRRKNEFEFTGRGGTNYEPVIQAAIDGHYKTLTILSDGECGEPPRPAGIDVMMVLPPGHTCDIDWIRPVYMDNYA